MVAGLLFTAGMRRSEVSALCWADVVDATDGDEILVTVRRSKTNQEGDVNDVRFVTKANLELVRGDVVAPLEAVVDRLGDDFGLFTGDAPGREPLGDGERVKRARSA